MDIDTLPPPPPSAVKARRKPKPKAPEGSALDNIPSGWKQNAEAGSSKQAAVVSVVPAGTSAKAPAPAGEKRARKPKKAKDASKANNSGRPVGDEVKVGAKKDKAKAVEKPKFANLKKEWECVPLAQSEVSRIPPVWTRDGRFYVTAQNTSIHVHSAAPPYAKKSTLTSAISHKAPITTLLLSPINTAHIMTASEDGTVKIWDLETGEMLQSIAIVDGKVMQMCVGEVAGRWEVFVTSSSRATKKSNGTNRVWRFPYPTTFTAIAPPITKMNKLGALPTALFISPTSLYLVALAANKAYTFLLPTTATSSDWTARLVKFVTDQALTCGAFAPTDKLSGAGKGEDWFATGDDKGVIRLWHGLGQAFRLLGGKGGKSQPDQEKRLPTTSLHWHAHAVAALAFTPSGSQLLSVGEESVLVQWHLGTGKREYIPRLGGRPIVSLAVRQAAARGQEEEWWMAFADGSVVKVGAGSGKVENVGQGVKIDPLRQINSTTPYPLTIHPSTSALVLPSSNPGTLQFINTSETSLLFDLEVAPSNRISRRDDKQIIPVAVELVAFSDPVKGKSEWMATVEGRKGDEWEGGGEVRNLKIWKWDGQRYLVNTQFPKPHGVSEITSLAFSPLNTPTSPELPYLLSTAIDGSAKLWQIRQAKRTEHGKNAAKRPATFELFWSSRSSWTYRSLPIYSASFSPDATIVALAHGSSGIVSLWDTESNVLLRALDASADLKDARRIAFVGDAGRWLAAAGHGGVVCWDLLSCEKTLFSPSNNIISLLPLPDNTFLTTFTITSSTVLTVHSPTTRHPLRSITVPHTLRSLLPLPSARPSPGRINFAAVSATGDLFRLGDDVSASLPIVSNLKSTKEIKGKLSIWQEMFGEHAFLSPADVEAQSTVVVEPTKKGGKASAVYDGPSHTLPPAHLLFDGFMKSILAGGVAPEPEETQDEGIKYEMDGMEVEETLVEGRGKERGVGAEEMKELEGFFRGLLGKGKEKVNGVKANGRHVEEEEEVVGVPGGKPKANGVATPKNAAVVEEEEDRVVESGGGSGRKGKKRRAPKDAA